MRLLELRANKETFNTISFNREGISIIAAIKETNDQRKTYNSVGKSLSISIIHFCLASNPAREFLDKLPGWEFYLDFEHDNEIYTVSRGTDNHKEIYLNENLMSLEDFKLTLERLVFGLKEGVKFISFRGLISRFIRPKKSSYLKYDNFINEEVHTPVAKLLNNAYLLGLDVDLILNKYELKERLDNLNNLKKQLSNPELKSIFDAGNDKDLEIKIVEYESDIERLTSSLEEFKVAEDYNLIKKEADELSYKLNNYRNRAAKLKVAIANIEKSLDLKPDISKDQILRLYNEAEVQLPDLVTKRLQELENFNSRLLDNRTQKLLEEKSKFVMQLSDVENTIRVLGKQEDEKLQYLNAHGALDEYAKLSKQLTDTQRKLDRLTHYKALLSDYKIMSEEVKKEFSDQNIVTLRYLDQAKQIIDRNIKLFKSFTEKFYADKFSGISVENNEKKNTIRFDINAKVQDDAGDGVNEVKIFCFDWTILKARNNHKVHFLFHDSRITDGLDTRQIKTMFQIAHKECEENKFQYIISLNQNVIESLRSEMDEMEHNSLINGNIVLKLSDKSDRDKLLGIQVDVDYSEEKAEA